MPTSASTAGRTSGRRTLPTSRGFDHQSNGCGMSITVVISHMALAHSKVTAQGQVSVPAKVRQRLGVGPGSVLEWDEDGDQVIVRKAGRYSSEDIHRVLFSKTPRRRTLGEMKDGIRRYIKKRHAGR
jgi:antitoxin PrlF